MNDQQQQMEVKSQIYTIDLPQVKMLANITLQLKI